MLPFCGHLVGSTAKKWFYEGSAQGDWDPREVQEPFRPNPNGVGDRTTTLRLREFVEYNFTNFSVEAMFI